MVTFVTLGCKGGGMAKRKGRFHTVAGTADRLGYKERTIRAWIASGRLEAFHFGKSVRVPDEAVEREIANARRIPIRKLVDKEASDGTRRTRS
jgi:excisionase family DNA binding protein